MKAPIFLEIMGQAEVGVISFTHVLFASES